MSGHTVRFDITSLKDAIIQSIVKIGLATPLIFVLLYYVAFLVYFKYHIYNIIGGNLASLITSPFNAAEDASGSYSSVMNGLLNNYVAVAVILWLSEVYSRHFSIKLKLLRPLAVFSMSILASYLLALSLLLVKGIPSGGTSIIGFSLTSFLFVSLLLDSPHYMSIAKRYVENKAINSTTTFISYMLHGLGPFFSVLFTGLFLLSYVIGNSSWWLHIAGGGIFFLLCLILLYTKFRRRSCSQLSE